MFWISFVLRSALLTNWQFERKQRTHYTRPQIRLYFYFDLIVFKKEEIPTHLQTPTTTYVSKYEKNLLLKTFIKIKISFVNKVWTNALLTPIFFLRSHHQKRAWVAKKTENENKERIKTKLNIEDRVNTETEIYFAYSNFMNVP